ncbi:MAG: signal peptide peptidase SppA [Geminicoccaceae bacterium]|nr:signal peptide peptidase SppA [Geminicoccaceae bacterium]
MKRFLIGFLAVIGALVLLVVVIAAFAGWWAVRHMEARDEPPLAIMLTLDLRHPIPEAPGLSPFALFEEGANPTMSEIVLGLDAAAADPRVRGLFVRLAETDHGFAKAQELRDAIHRLRAAGKEVVGWADSLGELGRGREGAMIAAAMGEFHLQPGGTVGLAGIGVEIPFVRPLLDKIGIEPLVDRRLEYKTMADNALEPRLTPANREMLDAMLDSLEGQLLRGIGDDRGIAPDRLRAIVDQGPFTADEAQGFGLIDGQGYLEEVRENFRQRLGPVAAMDLAAYVALQAGPRGFGIGAAPEGDAEETVIALLRAEGMVTRGSDGINDTVAADDLAARLYELGRDPSVDAIVLRLDTGGGSAVASETIAHALRQVIEEGTPVVLSMGNAAASGGYWIAMDASRIVAQPGTFTGSIGVIAVKPMVAELSARLGVNWEHLERGANADMWNISEPYDASGQARLDALLDDVYDRFVSGVARGRGLDEARVREIAKGRVWTGESALALGLVDRLGGIAEALEEASTAIGIDAGAPVVVRLYPEPEPPWQAAFDLLAEQFAAVRLIGGWLRAAASGGTTAHMPLFFVR